MAALRVAAWLCLAAWSAPLPVAAQALDPQVDVTAVDGVLHVAWNGTASASWLVTNDGPLSVTVDTAMEADGWSVEEAPAASFALGPGASRLVQARVAPSEAAEGGAGPPLALRATATDAAGRSDTATASVQTRVTARPPPPLVIPPPADTTARDMGIAVAALALPALGAYVALGLLYKVYVPRDAVRVLGVHGAWVHVRVRNRAPWAQTVLVAVNRPSEGWQVAGDADRVTVPPRAEQTYTVFVRRLGAIDDPARLRVAVRSRRSVMYPWRHHGSISIESEPIDLSTWSAKKIQAALQAAAPQALAV